MYWKLAVVEEIDEESCHFFNFSLSVYCKNGGCDKESECIKVRRIHNYDCSKNAVFSHQVLTRTVTIRNTQ